MASLTRLCVSFVGRNTIEHARRFINGSHRTGSGVGLLGVGCRVHSFQSHPQRFQSVDRATDQVWGASTHIRRGGSCLLATGCGSGSHCHLEFGIREMKNCPTSEWRRTAAPRSRSTLGENSRAPVALHRHCRRRSLTSSRRERCQIPSPLSTEGYSVSLFPESEQNQSLLPSLSRKAPIGLSP